jgi:hypothetical protein
VSFNLRQLVGTAVSNLRLTQSVWIRNVRAVDVFEDGHAERVLRAEASARAGVRLVGYSSQPRRSAGAVFEIELTPKALSEPAVATAGFPFRLNHRARQSNPGTA